MRTREQLKSRLKNYDDVHHIYIDKVGYIVWHLSTGDNIEMLFLEVAEKRKGHGTTLYREMVLSCERMRQAPYHSMFLFRRTDNIEGEKFYASLGFREQHLGESIYKEGGTTLMWIPWAELKKNLGINSIVN